MTAIVAGKERNNEVRSGQVDPGLIDHVRLALRLYRDPRISILLKMMLPLFALIYLVSPIDLIPDFILGLGQIDDLGVLTIAVLLISKLLPRLAPDEIVAEHRAAMGFDNDRDEQRGEVIVDAPYHVRDSAR